MNDSSLVECYAMFTGTCQPTWHNKPELMFMLSLCCKLLLLNHNFGTWHHIMITYQGHTICGITVTMKFDWGSFSLYLIGHYLLKKLIWNYQLCNFICAETTSWTTRVVTLIVATIYLQLIQNRYMFRSFTVLQCSHQHCVQPVASDVEVVGYL